VSLKILKLSLVALICGCRLPNSTTPPPVYTSASVSAYAESGQPRSPAPLNSYRLNGIVKDIATQNGIRGTKVTALGSPVSPVWTGLDGSYKLAELPQGGWTIEYNMAGYLPHPETKKIQVARDEQLDVELYLDAPNDLPYARKVAAQLDSRGRAGGGRTEDYLTQWNLMKKAGVQPSFRALVAGALNEQQSPAANIPEIKKSIRRVPIGQLPKSTEPNGQPPEKRPPADPPIFRPPKRPNFERLPAKPVRLQPSK
jgi:hypothetical protein